MKPNERRFSMSNKSLFETDITFLNYSSIGSVKSWAVVKFNRYRIGGTFFDHQKFLPQLKFL